ncbi:hypothetical protein SDC9_52691 [bioreactor metagenome]|uniref:Uncharacterized protein n=1 Tax=bioreactor metagenome TaxID=1076179 RepID=A0A644WRM0_9ZZZZ
MRPFFLYYSSIKKNLICLLLNNCKHAAIFRNLFSVFVHIVKAEFHRDTFSGINDCTALVVIFQNIAIFYAQIVQSLFRGTAIKTRLTPL